MKTKLRSLAYEKIKDRIIYFALKPGEKIFEAQIAAELAISRTPVREALLLLENEGLVVCDEKIGYMVRKVAPKEMDEYFAIRSLVEEFGAPFIVKNISDSDITALEENIAEAEKYIESKDLYNLMRCETQFHEILYKATDSEVFVDTIKRHIYKFQWLRVIALKFHDGDKNSLRDHRKMVEAIKNKDVKGLQEIMRDHIQKAKEKCLMFHDIL